ncbi:MAG TPA: alpha/beta hydrolase [Dehalococcoidia bacterium]|nr:alpha/beta hydrolase [Dehalococcoidia bacterium]
MGTLTANGIELHCIERGAGDPVLFIAGLGMDHRAWTPVVARLEDAFRCITFDNRDAGRSQRTPGAYTVADMADDAAGVLDALGVERADVAGLSMGGAIAQELAIRRPERVRRLVLIATYTSGDPRGTAIFAAHALLRRTLSREDYVRATSWSVYSHQDYRREGFVEAQVRASAENALWQEQDAYERQVAATTNACTEDRLRDIAAPTLIIAGTEDILTPKRFQDTLAAGIPDSRMVWVEGAAHGIAWSHAGRVAGEIRAFLGG